MEKAVDFGQLKIDPAPFQLPEKSSLLKVHSLFSMLGMLAFIQNPIFTFVLNCRC